MHVIYHANNLIDAHLVKHALENAGIPVHISGESLMGGMGELPLFGLLRVCVPEAALEQAGAIVRELDLDRPVSEDLGDEEDGTSGNDVLPA